MPSTATSILDGLSTSVAVKAPCVDVETTNITLSGLQGYTAGDRVLVVGQTDPVENGIYEASSGSWTRTPDADGNRDLVCGTRVMVRGSGFGVEYELTTANPIVIDTSSLTFELRYGANATYDPTSEEVAAGLTILNDSYPPYNLLRYCVADTGNNTTNSTTAIQALLGAVSYGERIFVPALPDGHYFRITAALSMPISKSLTICGESRNNSRIRQATTGADVFTSAATFASPANNTHYSNLYIDSAAGRYGIWLNGNGYTTIESCNFGGFTSGATASCVRVTDSLCLTFFDNRFRSSRCGIYSVGSVGTSWNGGSVDTNIFEALTQYAIEADRANGITIIGNTIQTCGTATGGTYRGGIYIYSGSAATDGLFIAGNYFEENCSRGTSSGAVKYFDILLGLSTFAHGVTIVGNYFNGNGGTARTVDDYVPIRTMFADGWEVSGNLLNTGTNFVAFETSASVSNCRFGKLGFHSAALASFVKGTGLTATYHNLPSSFAFVTSGNEIDGLTKISGEIAQRYIRCLELPVHSTMWTTAFAGTGAITADGKGALVNSGATAASTASATIGGLGLLAGAGQGSIDWTNKEIVADFVVSNIAAGTSTGISFLMLTTAAAVADPTTRSIGFKVIQDALWGLTHNGTTLGLTNLSTSLSAGLTTTLRVEKSGSSITWFVNGLQVGTTSSNVPNTSTTTCVLNLSVANGANAAQQRLGLYDAKITCSQ